MPFILFSSLISSIISREPKGLSLTLIKGRTLTLAEAFSPPHSISASITRAGSLDSAVERIFSSIHTFFPTKNSLAFFFRISLALVFRIRYPDLLQVWITPSSFNVTTAFDMLSSIDSA